MIMLRYSQLFNGKILKKNETVASLGQVLYEEVGPPEQYLV